jgi:hypothetical protein
MLERLYFDHGVHLLVEWDEKRKAACVSVVIYDHAAAARRATQLAASMGVPVRHDSCAPSQAVPSGTAA